MLEALTFDLPLRDKGTAKDHFRCAFRQERKMAKVDQAASIWSMLIVIGPIMLALTVAWALSRNYWLVRAHQKRKEWRAHRNRTAPTPRIIRAAHRAVY
ncbi:hypothetical protein [Sphingomonas montanisoli]|nr:hypothetical protein [Sphingomonas montanisoli]